MRRITVFVAMMRRVEENMFVMIEFDYEQGRMRDRRRNRWLNERKICKADMVLFVEDSHHGVSETIPDVKAGRLLKVIGDHVEIHKKEPWCKVISFEFLNSKTIKRSNY
jgi:hypothetical protein